MSDTFDPDAYLKAKPADQGSSSFDPDAYLAGGAEPADHGMSERQKLSPVGKALSPITEYPKHLGYMAKEAQGQIAEGWDQMSHPGRTAEKENVEAKLPPPDWRQGSHISDAVIGAGKVALGSVANAWAPIGAAVRSVVGQPIEDTTGIPREYTELAAQLAMPGIGLRGFKTGPKPMAPPKPGADPFGVTLSEGEATGDLPAIRREQAARRDMLGSKSTKQAEAFDAQRAEQLANAREDVTRQLDPNGGQILSENPQQAAGMAQQSVQREAGRAKNAVDQAYRYAESLPGEIHPDALKDMGIGIREELNSAAMPVTVDEGTPVAARMLKFIDDRVSKLKIRNDADLQNPIPQNISGVTLEGVNQLRKVLSEMRGDAIKNFTNATDARAANAVIKAFDERIDQAVNSGAFRGDPRAIDAWNSARAAHSERMRTYGNDAVGKKIQDIIGNPRAEKDPATINAVADFMYGASGTSPSSLHVGVAKRLQKILGADSPEWAAIRQGYFQRLAETAEGIKGRGYGTIANRLYESLNGRGSDLANVMFTPAQRDLLRSYADLHRTLEVPRTGANWSETSTFVNRALAAIGTKVSGLIGAVIGHAVAPGAHGAGEYAGSVAAGKMSSFLENSRNAKQIAQQMPLVGQRLKQWQQAVAAQQRNNSIVTQSRAALAATNVASALSKLGINNASTVRLLHAGPSGPSDSEAQEHQPSRIGGPPDYWHARAEGGRVGDDYNTFLTPEQETGFNGWKQQNAPNDSGYDYDLRGAYLNNMQRDPNNDHMGDQFKKPNHPTFSDQSQYATGDQRDRAGHWAGEQFIPPVATRVEGGTLDQPEQAYDPMSGTQITPTVGAEAAPTESQSSLSKIAHRLTGTQFGEPRTQAWPERMVRSGATLAGNVLSGEQPMLPPGLRREDYTDQPAPSAPTEDSTWLGKKLNVAPVHAEPNDPAYERAQDMAGMAGSGGLGGISEGAGSAALGTSPFLRPALKYNDKIYKAPVKGTHLDAIPPEIYPEFQKQAMSGEDISHFNFGFMNHKGQFLNREDALKYGIDNGLLDPQAAKQGALTSTLMSDSQKSGAALSALEHQGVKVAEKPILEKFDTPEFAPYRPLVAAKPELAQPVSDFLELAKAGEAKYGKDWENKLQPQEVEKLSKIPGFLDAVKKINEAQNQGVFDRIMNASVSRRSFLGNSVVAARLVSSADKLGKVMEGFIPKELPKPDLAAEALPKIGAIRDTFSKRGDDLSRNHWRAEREIRDKMDAELRQVYEKDEERNGPSDRTLYGAEKDIKDKYQPVLDKATQEYRQNYNALKKEFHDEIAGHRQNLNLPKLSEEQQHVLDYVVRPGGGVGSEFADSSIKQNPYYLKEFEHDSFDRDPRWAGQREKWFEERKKQGKLDETDIPMLLSKMTPEQKMQIAEHIKPAMLQDADLSIKDARTIAKAFPSLKGFQLFSDSSTTGAPIAALEHQGVKVAEKPAFEQPIAQPAPNNIPQIYKPLAEAKPEISKSIQDFVNLSRDMEKKYDTSDWVSKLTPEDVEKIKADPKYNDAVDKMNGASLEGAFTKLLDQPVSRRSFLTNTAAAARLVASSGKLGKMLENFVPKETQPVLPMPDVELPDWYHLTKAMRKKISDKYFSEAKEGVVDPNPGTEGIADWYHENIKNLADTFNIKPDYDFAKYRNDFIVQAQDLIKNRYPNDNKMWNHVFDEVRRRDNQHNKTIDAHESKYTPTKEWWNQYDSLHSLQKDDLLDTAKTFLSDSSTTGAPIAALEHAPHFYSAVEKTIESAPQQKMHGEQWANWLKNQPGVKPDELQYTGIDKWLREQKGPVTKQQVADYIDKNKIEVNDVMKGKPALDENELWAEAYNQVKEDFPKMDESSDAFHERILDRVKSIQEVMQSHPETQGTKYHAYQLPGGNNYREHLLTLPNKLIEPTQEMLDLASRRIYGRDFGWDDIPPNQQAQVRADIKNDPRGSLGANHLSIEQQYKSSHWDEPNVLAHVRTNERDVGGTKSLHLEELQSDWHQQGRKQGYVGDTKGWTASKNKDSGGWDVKTPDGEVRYRLNRDEASTSEEAVKEASRQLASHKSPTVVPNVPFKTTWPELAMKRMIHKAAEEGTDRISWTPGEAQATRYDLSKHIDDLHYNPETQHLVGEWKNGARRLDERVPLEKLETMVGKDVAQKILDQPKNKEIVKKPIEQIRSLPDNFEVIKDPSGGYMVEIKGDRPNMVWGRTPEEAASRTVQWLNSNAGHQFRGVYQEPAKFPGYQSLHGADLKVGGEGMKGFYDQMMPKMVEKLGKQYGVKVKQGEVLGDTKGGMSGEKAMDILGLPHSYWEKIKNDPEARDKLFQDARDKGQPVHYFDIPPKMKEDVLKKGFPLFSDTAHGGLLNQNARKDKQKIERPIQKGKTEPEIDVPKERAAGGRVLASNIATAPSEAQKSAGNYSKDHLHINGLAITIENAKGQERSGIGKDGERWSVKMPASYGYLKSTNGADNDHLDIYLGPHIRSDKVFVINQIDADTKQFDETKSMLGFRDLKHAIETYVKGFSDGKGMERIGSIVPCTMQEFKQWVRSDNHHKPFALVKQAA